MVKLYVLGRCRIQTPYATILPRANKLFQLAVYLIVERGRPISRRSLITLFWPDRSEKSANHSLREALLRLRQRGFPLQSDNESLQVLFPKGGACLDIDQLGSVDPHDLATQEYWVLPGFDPSASAVYRDWVDDTRVTLQAKVISYLLETVKHAQMAAQWDVVANIANQILAIDQDNSAARAAMAHAKKALNSRSRSERYTPDGACVPADSVGDRHSRITNARYAGGRDAALVGRTEDLRILTEALQAAADGRGSCVYLHGPAGIGKSRLVRELVNIASLDGVAIGKTVCQPHDVHRPFSVFIDIAPVLRDLPGGGGCYEYTNICLDRLTQPHTQASMPTPDSDAAEYLYEHTRQAIFDLVSAVVHEQPLILIVEDVHWSDPVSWAFLRELVSKARSLPVLFVCTSREPWSDAQWGKSPEYITTHGLSQLTSTAAKSHAIEYAAGIGREATTDFLDWCVHIADGNPYYMEEQLNHWAVTGIQFSTPSSLAALIDDRLDKLTEMSLRVLQTCAILGKNSTIQRLSAVLQYPEHAFLSAIEELGQSRMLAVRGANTPKDDSVICRHDLLAVQAVRKLSEHGLQLLHYRIGTVLEGELDTAKSASLFWDCAQHWYAGGNSLKAVDLGLNCVVQLVDIGLFVDATNICKELLEFCATPHDRMYVIQTYVQILHLMREWAELTKLLEEVQALKNVTKSDPNPHDDLELVQLDAAWQLYQDWNQVVVRARLCVEAQKATLSHRVQAGLILLKLGTNMGDTTLMHWVYNLLSPIIAKNDPEDYALNLLFELIYHAICGNSEISISVGHQLLEYAKRHYRGVRLVRSLVDCASAFRRNGEKSLSTILRMEAFDIAIQEKAYALAAMSAHQLVISSLDEGNTDLAQEWAGKFEQMHRPMAEFWGARAFILSATHIALCLGDVARAESLFLPHADSFLNDPVALCRSSALVAAIRIKIARRVKHEQVIPLVEALRKLHTLFRSMGMYDYESVSLYHGMVYIGRAEEGQTIFNEYIHKYRRDRSAYSEQVNNILLVTGGLIKQEPLTGA